MAINGTAGNDTRTGTAGNNIFRLGQGGEDTAYGLGGNDIFRMRGALSVDDILDGGADRDVVVLRGNYGSFTFGAGTIVDVEGLRLAGASNYNLTMNDGNVAAGNTLAVNGAPIGTGGSSSRGEHGTVAVNFTFDGSAEADGHLQHRRQRRQRQSDRRRAIRHLSHGARR